MPSAVLWTIVAAAVAVGPTAARASDAIAYVASASGLTEKVIVVDARAQMACLTRSIAGARCLPAADFLGPHGRLANFREIFWLLGTAGLSGGEHVLVVGNDPTERDFVAGMLYLCGQRKISILTLPMSQGAGLPADQLGPGIGRAMTRNPVYQGRVRDDDIVLRTELARALASGSPPKLLDGRTEEEYWGERIRALRGGHLPGAQSLPLSAARSRLGQGQLELSAGKKFVVYGHDPLESVAYFTLLRAGARAAVMVLLDGWVDWANHPDLPMAATSYPDMKSAPARQREPDQRWLVPLALFNLAGLLFLAGGLVYSVRRRK